MRPPPQEEGVKEDADIGEDRRDCGADGKVQDLEGGRTVEEEQLFPHGTVTWDPPRRSGSSSKSCFCSISVSK